MCIRDSTRSLRVVRQNGQEYEVNTVKDLDYSVYKMRNGDVAVSYTHLDVYKRQATVGKDEKKNCCNSFAHGVRFAGF